MTQHSGVLPEPMTRPHATRLLLFGLATWLALTVAATTFGQTATDDVQGPSLETLCIRVAADIDANLGKQLAAMRDAEPEAFAQRLRKSPRLIKLAQLLRDDPNDYKLKMLEVRTDQNVLRLAREARAAQAAGRDAAEQISELRNQLRLQEAFAFRARDEHLCRLQAEAEKEEAELATRKENVEDRVRERLQSLIDPAVEMKAVATASNTVPGRVADASTAPPLPADVVDSCMQVATEIWPDLARQLTTLRTEAPEAFSSRLRASRSLVALGELRLRDQKLYERKRQELRTDIEVIRLARQIRTARDTDEPTADLEKNLYLQVMLQEAFRHLSRMEQLERAQATITRLQQELAVERQTINERVEARISDLLDVPPP